MAKYVRKTKRTHYRFACRILFFVLVLFAVGWLITGITLDVSSGIATANELEYKARLSEADRVRAELLQQLTTAPVESEPIVVEPSYRDHLGEFTITYYCACVKCCGKTDGITASGAVVREGVTVAVDPKVIPLGTYLYIDGIGYRVAQDVGGAIQGNRIDVYMKDHNAALICGVEYNVNVWRLLEQ